MVLLLFASIFLYLFVAFCCLSCSRFLFLTTTFDAFGFFAPSKTRVARLQSLAILMDVRVRELGLHLAGLHVPHIDSVRRRDDGVLCHILIKPAQHPVVLRRRRHDDR